MALQNARTWALSRLNLLAMMAALLAIVFWYQPDRGSKVSAESAIDATSLYRAARRQVKSHIELAGEQTAHATQLSAEHRSAITRIDAELDRKAQQYIDAEIDRWVKRGGFHAGPLPGFDSPASPQGRELARMKRSAEAKIARVLSAEEKARWEQVREIVAPTAVATMITPVAATR